MNRLRLLFLSLLLCAGALLGLRLLRVEEPPKLPYTLEALYSCAGAPVKSADRVLTTLSQVSAEDEARISERIRKDLLTNLKVRKSKHLTALVRELAGEERLFDYEVFVRESPFINAFSCPGGIIVVHDALLEFAESEDEIAFVLAHELGHIEMGHLRDAVRGDILVTKYEATTLPVKLGEILSAFAELSFSKAQEIEADNYAFRTMVLHGGSLESGADFFDRLAKRYYWSRPGIDPLETFLQTHPSHSIRAENMRSRAQRWNAWSKNA